jgi:predicted RNA binding protein YcfA (HicA-like mRNA interferase family)
MSMPALDVVVACPMARVLARSGWYVSRQAGSHAVYKHPQRSGRVILAMHRGDIPIGTLQSILDQAGLTSDELRRLL